MTRSGIINIGKTKLLVGGCKDGPSMDFGMEKIHICGYRPSNISPLQNTSCAPLYTVKHWMISNNAFKMRSIVYKWCRGVSADRRDRGSSRKDSIRLLMVFVVLCWWRLLQLLICTRCSLVQEWKKFDHWWQPSGRLFLVKTFPEIIIVACGSQRTLTQFTLNMALTRLSSAWRKSVGVSLVQIYSGFVTKVQRFRSRACQLLWYTPGNQGCFWPRLRLYSSCCTTVFMFYCGY